VRQHVLDVGVLLVAATVVAVLLVVTEPGLRTVVVHAYVIGAGAVLMALVVGGVRRTLPRRKRSAFTAALGARSEERDAEPAQLQRLERDVTLGVATAHDLHTKLLPQLREIARCRLESTGKRPSEETLGRWWELLHPDREPPDDKFAPGLPEADLRALVADLERM
jgi:hypothetical protein